MDGIIALIVVGLIVNFFIFVEIRDREYSLSIKGTSLDGAATRAVICILAIVPWGISIAYVAMCICRALWRWMVAMTGFVKEP